MYVRTCIFSRVCNVLFVFAFTKSAFVRRKQTARSGCVGGEKEAHGSATRLFVLYATCTPSAVVAIVFLLQPVSLLFPSGNAPRKSLFYGKQRCLETPGRRKIFARSAAAAAAFRLKNVARTARAVYSGELT